MNTIREGIRLESLRLRDAHPWLKQQSALGALILFSAVLAVVGSALAFLHGAPVVLCIVVSGVAASIAHEIEHDLFHKMYFPRHAWMRHAMLLAGWLIQPNTVNPWLRREAHLNHHRISGMPEDLEVRFIMIGQAWGLLRLLRSIDPLFSAIIGVSHWPGKKLQAGAATAAVFFPLLYLHQAIWYGFLLHLAGWDFIPMTPLIKALLVAVVIPNVIRHFCLTVVSSNVHYYGDLEAGNVMQQVQVFTGWKTWPFQLFTCNFGSTHAIHHFWVPEPFYIRQASAPVAHRVMRQEGVRFNDFATFRRANRFQQI